MTYLIDEDSFSEVMIVKFQSGMPTLGTYDGKTWNVLNSGNLGLPEGSASNILKLLCCYTHRTWYGYVLHAQFIFSLLFFCFVPFACSLPIWMFISNN